MKYKVHQKLIFLLLLLLCANLPTHAATYTYPSGLTITTNTDFTGGTYDVQGDFTLSPGVTLTIKGDTTIQATGNIHIQGTMLMSSSIACPVRLKSTNGNIVIEGNINLVSAVGTVGGNGAQTVSGSSGGDGKSSNLDIVAEKGNINIKNPITVVGGTGGIGGTGGGSSGSTDAGNGGGGGKGGNGGAILIMAKAGRVDISNTVKSLGGTGGRGGTGGPDQSIFGSAGDGGAGGNGGVGGPITIVGQDVYINSGAAFDVSGGAAGLGGDGGSGGTLSGGGSDGIAGTAGGAGSVALKGGELYYYTSSTPLKTFPAVGVTPSGATKTLTYDTVVPATPVVVLPYYKNASGEYYTNSMTLTLTIQNPNDGGFDYAYPTYTTNTYKSGISSFSVSITGASAQNFTYSGTGDCTIHPTLPTSTSNLYNIVVTASDKYGNKTNSATIVLHLDKNAPIHPTMCAPVLQANGTTYNFSWNPSSDESSISNYVVNINDSLFTQTGTAYTYAGSYNEQINIAVQARDGAGNLSDPSLTQTVYTVSQNTSIKSSNVQVMASGGLQANITFTSVGGKAAGYQLKYFEIDYLGNMIGSEIIRQIGAISTPEGQNYTHAVLNLKPEAQYRFFIRTYNKNVNFPNYASWIPYDTPVDTSNISNSPAAARTLTANESWEGTVTLTGDIIVPQNIILTVKPGTIVKIPTGSKLIINGTINCDGTTAPITFTNTNVLNAARTNVWRGIYLSPTSRNSVFKNVTLENASRGLALEGQTLTLTGVTCRNNGIGIELASSTITINSSRFEGNTLYGIKENNASCVVKVYTNTFLTNGVAPYYSYTKTILGISDLNTALYGSGNQ